MITMTNIELKEEQMKKNKQKKNRRKESLETFYNKA